MYLRSIRRSRGYQVVSLVLLVTIIIGWATMGGFKGQAIRAAAYSPAGVDGCPFYPAENIWNYDISNLPVHPNSDNFIKSIGLNTPLHPDFGTGKIGIPYM